MKLLSIAIIVLGVFALLFAGYCFSFCVPLESACHMSDEVACARLAQTLRFSGWLAVGALGLMVTGASIRVGVYARQRLAAQSRGGEGHAR
jgi:hypothetical protein